MSHSASTLCKALAAFGLCLAGQAGAQEMPASRFQAITHRAPQPTTVDYSKYYASEATPVADAPPASDKPPAAADEPAACESCGGGDDAEEANPCGDPWTLQSWLTPCLGEDTQWKYGGWIEGGITGNGNGVVSLTGNLPVAFNYASDGAMLNQAWWWTERTAKTDGCGFDWGFRVDYIFGTDAPFTQAYGDLGYDNDWDASRQYASALPQLYLVGAYNDLTVKAGHFYTPIGYEVVPATGNFFYSHSYTMVWGEPFTHTGIQADYKYDDNWTFTAGWVQGWDSGFNNHSDANLFLGGLTWTINDRNSLIYMATVGDWGNGDVLNNGNIYMQSLVFKHKFCNGWQYILQSDLANNTNIPGPSTSWYGVNQYLTKEINCCWSVGARFEWFRDEDGVRVLDSFGQGNAGSYYEATLGANWKPHANVNIRPEVRYDWFDGNGNGGTPFSDATRSSQFTYGVDAYFTF